MTANCPRPYEPLLPGVINGFYPPYGYAAMGGVPTAAEAGGYGGYGMGGPMHRIGFGVPPQPLLQPSLSPLGKPKDYKEGGSAVKFDSFDGQKNKLKALTFLQQFDAAFSGGHFTEFSKVRKAASFLKGNALQWWTTLLQQGMAPATWVEFKQAFATLWMTSTFEVDVITAWHQLDSRDCHNLEEYNKKFWDAFLPVTSFRHVPFVEQVEKYTCGLPKELRDYCIKTRVSNLTQLMERAQTGYAMLTGKMTGFKDSTFAKKASRPVKEIAESIAEKALYRRTKGKKRAPDYFAKTAEARKEAVELCKCFICEETLSEIVPANPPRTKMRRGFPMKRTSLCRRRSSLRRV